MSRLCLVLSSFFGVQTNSFSVYDPSIHLCRKLQTVNQDNNAKFISYIDGEWKFQVPHFTKYGLEEDDEDGGESAAAPSSVRPKLQQQQPQLPQQSARVLTASSSSSILLTASASALAPRAGV